jgi:hypothetical protein
MDCKGVIITIVIITIVTILKKEVLGGCACERAAYLVCAMGPLKQLAVLAALVGVLAAASPAHAADASCAAVRAPVSQHDRAIPHLDLPSILVDDHVEPPTVLLALEMPFVSRPEPQQHQSYYIFPTGKSPPSLR